MHRTGMVRVWVAGKTVWSPCYTRAISERFRNKELIIKRYINSPSLLSFTFRMASICGDSYAHQGCATRWWSIIISISSDKHTDAAIPKIFPNGKLYGIQLILWWAQNYDNEKELVRHWLEVVAAIPTICCGTVISIS